MLSDIKAIVNTFNKDSNLYQLGKFFYRLFKPNLRNQMMYQMISENINNLIKKTDKILIVAPHPDDEVIACGGIIAKYRSQIDVLCINSSGVKYEKDENSAEDIAELRIQEFYNVMLTAGIRKAWIAKIWGIPPMFNAINSHINDYISKFNWKEYDFIFVPHRIDGHREHRYVGNHLVPLILKKTGYKSNLRIIRYEVWGTLADINYFEDISEYIEEKERLINLYISRKSGEYAARMSALNYYRGILAKCQYAEAYKVETVQAYLNYKDDKSWKK